MADCNWNSRYCDDCNWCGKVTARKAREEKRESRETTSKILEEHYRAAVLQCQKEKQALKDQIAQINETLVYSQNEYARLNKLNR